MWSTETKTRNASILRAACFSKVNIGKLNTGKVNIGNVNMGKVNTGTVNIGGKVNTGQ